MTDLDVELAKALGVPTNQPRSALLSYVEGLVEVGELLFHASREGSAIRLNLDTHNVELIGGGKLIGSFELDKVMREER